MFLEICMIVAVGFTGGSAAETGESSSTILGRIINGTEIDITAAPHQVALQVGKRFICGGSIISSTFVLTAGHCGQAVQACQDVISIRIGSTFKDKGGIVIPVKNVIIHPKYDSPTLDYDVALLELSDEIHFNEKAKAINLTDKVPTGNIQVTGWGKTKPQNCDYSETLQATQMKIMDTESCIEKLRLHQLIIEIISGQRIKVTQRMFCAQAPSTGACNGDSGGAVTQNGTQVGIVSWAAVTITLKPSIIEYTPCNSPNVFVNIAKREIQSFIRKYVKKTEL